MIEPALFTIGYEGCAAPRFTSTLAGAGVRVLVDVRMRAASRKPGFGRTALAAESASAGIRYLHEPTLGNPRDNREPFHRRDPVAFALYDDLLMTVGDPAFHRVLALARAAPTAIMCFERDHAICHRSAIAQRAADDGVHVVHL